MMLDLETGPPPPNRVELTSVARDMALVALIGEHDLGHYETLKAVLARAALRAPNVVVDLSECAFVDSTVLQLMLHTHAVATRAGGAFAVVIAPEPGAVSRLAELMRLDLILPVHPSLDAARASFDSH
jgi:anti-anti-sigma factor